MVTYSGIGIYYLLFRAAPVLGATFAAPGGGGVSTPPPLLTRLLRNVEENGKKRPKARQKPLRNYFSHFLAQVKIEAYRGQRSQNFPKFSEKRTLLRKMLITSEAEGRASLS